MDKQRQDFTQLTQHQEDEKFMRRCFELAVLGAGSVSPNPMVGAVVVHKGRIIGEGYHMQYGQAHAEVNAINSVEDKSLLKEATIYVSLEPCCHYGKTPPCAKLLVESEVKRCVISCRDTNPKVSGGGIKILRDNNIEVTIGVLEQEGRYLNRIFFLNQEKRRPYVIVKFAQSMDGFIDVIRKDDQKVDYWFTNDALKVFVHRQRAEHDAIMVGYNTVKNDNPSLTTRYYAGKNPLRVVYDRDLSLSHSHKIFSTDAKTLVFNDLITKQEGSIAYHRLEKGGIEEMLNVLYDKGVCSLIVEGGKRTIEDFLAKGLCDQMFVLTGDACLGEGIKRPAIPSYKSRSTSWIGNNRSDIYLF